MRFRKLLAVPRDHFLAGLHHAGQIAVIVKRAREIQMSLGENRLLLDRAAQFLD